MKNLKKIVGVFILVMVALLFLPNKALALEDTDELIKRIAPDGKNATIKSVKPVDYGDIQFLISPIIEEIIDPNESTVYASCDEPDFTSCHVTFQSNNFIPDEYGGEKSEWIKTYDITFKYDEPSATSIPMVKSYLDKLKDIDYFDSSTWYRLEDLSLINYYLTSENEFTWNDRAKSLALKFSDVNSIIDNANISFKISAAAGGGGTMYDESMGGYRILYNGYAYGWKEQKLILTRVIYIPEDTEETTKAYIDAAKKRIDNYLGKNSIKIELGGAVSDLEEYIPSPYLELEDTDGNYYNVTIGKTTYMFHIVKANSDKLLEPTYKGIDLDSKIEIASKDSSIPLDAALIVKNVNDSSIKDIIGTKNYKTYDISLYSDAKEKSIEKLENGKFLVRIPIPTELNGKNLIVYYITSNGTKEDYEVTIKNGYAEFETDHFSKYTLAEKLNSTAVNPDTGDNIELYIGTLIVSTIGFLSIFRYLKKRIYN